MPPLTMNMPIHAPTTTLNFKRDKTLVTPDAPDAGRNFVSASGLFCSRFLGFNKIVIYILVGLSNLLGHGSILAAQQVADSLQKNSMRKVRIQPSKQAQRIGAAVSWQPDLETALAKSRETGKPVFWYVHTIDGTFMDRKSEIDRYMMGGPFSWPHVIEDLNKRYIPVRLPKSPTPSQQAKYDLLPYKFIEPGFLILKSDGSEALKVDRLTTLHVDWLWKLLAKQSRAPETTIALSTNLERFSQGDYGKLATDLKTLANAGQATCEDGLLLGMSLFRLGRHDEATKIWKLTSEQYPNDPLAWKAAAEADKIGPFVRGFEIHRRLPQAAYQFDQTSSSAAPKSTYSQSDVRIRGVRFLLGMQNQDGGFRDSDYDFGGTDSLPNVHVAVTSLAGTVLVQELARDTKVKVMDQGERAAVAAAVKSAIGFVSNDKNINKVDRDEILWAYAYRLRFLVEAKKLTPDLGGDLDLPAGALDQHISAAVAALESVQSRRGSWYHEYNNPFVTATALLALFQAHDAGAKVNSEKVEKGLRSLRRDRFGNGAFPYDSSGGANRRKPGTNEEIAESAGRMPLCELGLWHWGSSDDAALVRAIEHSFVGQASLDRAFKYDDHTSTLGYGGFFFWYDMRARSEAISQVKDSAAKTKFASQQREIIMSVPEIDGCFVDSHELGRVYGTAMALLSLDYLE